VARIRHNATQRIAKDGCCLLERHLVFGEIYRSLLRVPLELTPTYIIRSPPTARPSP
jgi:hypothetical protein